MLAFFGLYRRRHGQLHRNGLQVRLLTVYRSLRYSVWRLPRSVTINVLIGYGYHPATTATYLQRSLERRAQTTFVGTPYQHRPGFLASGDIGEIVAGLGGTPDLYLHVDSGAAWYFPRGLTQLECPTACYLIDVHVRPKDLLKQAMFFDYAFTAQRDFVAVLRRAGHPQAHWLPLACDPEIHRHYDVPVRYDIGFVGAVDGAYARRRTLIERLERRFTLSEYRRRYTPAEMAEVYSASRLVFNCSLRHEVNMRVFEGPATGALLLTDRIGNGLPELVTDGEHVVIYDDAQVVDLAAQYLRDNAAREKLARQGYEHVRAHHTYDHRVATILDTIFSTAPALDAPLRRRPSAEMQLAYAEIFSRAHRIGDTVRQFRALPTRSRYRAPGLKHVALAVVRRVKYG